MDPHLAYCEKLLNNLQSNYSDSENSTENAYECCKNPELFLWSNTFEECTKICGGDERNDMSSKNETEEYGCCRLVCILTKMEFLRFSTDPNVMPQVEVKGVIAVYMQSVDNDPIWLPIVKTATERCFDDIYGLLGQGYYCNVIPNSLKVLTDCTYNEYFMKCPYWNPKQLSRCELALEYQKECSSRI